MKMVALLVVTFFLSFVQIGPTRAGQPVASGAKALRDLQAETGIVLDPSTLTSPLMETQKYNLGPHNWQTRWFVQEAYYRIGIVQRGPLVTDLEIDTYIAKKLMGNPRNPDPVCEKLAAPALPQAFKLPVLEKCTTIINVNRTYFFSVLHFSLHERRSTLFVMDSSPKPYNGVYEILLNILSRIGATVNSTS